jgi:diguanylate cyclase (GGDEF)-like protein/PAS domain S-box-containing protein
VREARPADDDAQRLRAALDAAEQALVVVDAAGRVVEANRTALRVTHLLRDDVLGRPLTDLAVQEGADEQELAAIRAAVDGTPVVFEARRAGRAVEVRATPLPGGGATFVSQGVAAYREEDWHAARGRLLDAAGGALAAPRSLDATLEALADLLVPEWGDGCLCALVEPDGTLRIAALRHADRATRDAMREMLPQRAAEAREGGLLARLAADRAPLLISPQDSDELPAELRSTLTRFGIGTIALTPLIVQDELVGVLGLGRAADARRQLGREDLGVLSLLGDRAAQGIHAARLNEAMRAAESRFRAAFEHAPIGIALLRPTDDGRLRFAEVNSSFCTIVGDEREAIIGRDADAYAHPDDPGGERDQEGVARLVRADGETRWVHTHSAPLEDGSVVTQFQDVTDRRRFQTELEHLTSHDTLTGLLNRRRLEEAVEQALANVRRHGDGAAVVTLDIDNFKHVNDAYGHSVGDAVLRAVAVALRSRVRATDQVGRLGGDEFGVVLTRTEAEAAQGVADELLRAVRELRVPAGERTVRVTASVGLRSLDSAEPSQPEELLSEADMAMYDAKERGRDRISVIHTGDHQPEQVRARLHWFERIRDALERSDGFRLYEQPILRLRDRTMDRSELLVRMTDERGRIVEPARFLPVAERYGQVRAIDRWVLRSAVRLLGQRAAAGRAAPLELNLSGDSISDPSVVDFIVAEIEAADIDPALLIFEVTETSAIGNLEHARVLAERLAALGCGFALDDFGAGFGSFAYLKHLPLDVIKIDGQFIRGLCRSRADQVTVRAMVDIARGLGKETVAECVEDAETLELLNELGVDHAQGYHIGRPAPAGIIPAFA